MHFIIIKAMFRKRWNVFAMGHLEGDATWLAAFRNREDALRWCGTNYEVEVV